MLFLSKAWALWRLAAIKRLQAPVREECSLAEADRGAIAVEFALVLPFLLTMLFGALQIGILFLNIYDLHTAAQEAARRVAVGDMTTAQASAFVNNTFNPEPEEDEEPPEAVGVNISTVDDRVTVDLSFPMSRIGVLDYLGILNGNSVSTSVTMRVE